MANSNDLSYFREEWMKEIKRAKLEISGEHSSSSSLGKNIFQSKSAEIFSNFTDDSGNESKHEICMFASPVANPKEGQTIVTDHDANATHSYPAFEIANSCLSLKHYGSNLNHLDRTKMRKENEVSPKGSQLVKCLKHDFCSTHSWKTQKYPKIEKPIGESYLDILINDINEVVGLPFFDLELPKEIAIKIFSFLSLTDLGRCALVNSKWKLLSEIDLIWYRQCLLLNVNPGVSHVTERINWKQYLKDSLNLENILYRNWSERLCQVSELEYEKGGTLSCVSVSGSCIVSGYNNGVVKLWHCLGTESAIELHDFHESDLERPSVKIVSIHNNTIAAGYNDGIVKVWKDFKFAHQIRVVDDLRFVNVGFVGTQAICVADNTQFKVYMMQDQSEWNEVFELVVSDKILGITFINQDSKDENLPFIIVLTKSRLASYTPKGQEIEYEFFEIGAQLSCFSCIDNQIFCGISPFGYSILEGYMVRAYDCFSGKMIFSLPGTQSVIHCMDTSAVNQTSKIVVGCSDYRIRLHNTKNNSRPLSFSGLFCCPTTAQADGWKVVGGGVNGTVCVWNQSNQSLLWSTNLRHRTEFVHFTKSLLVTVHVPAREYSREATRYADDLIEHRRNRGVIRLYDFSADTAAPGVHEFCKSNFDDTSGYNYNITLAMPYDSI